MKFLLLLLFLLPLFSYSQEVEPKKKSRSKHYGNLGITTFLSDKFDKRGGLSFDFGYLPDPHFGIGGGVDFFMFSKSKKFTQLYGDIRGFFAGGHKIITPFIALQPGIILYEHTDFLGFLGTTTSGSFAGNILGGIVLRPKKGIRFFFDCGYSNISFITSSVTTRYGGLKIELGISF